MSESSLRSSLGFLEACDPSRERPPSYSPQQCRATTAASLGQQGLEKAEGGQERKDILDCIPAQEPGSSRAQGTFGPSF